MVAHENIHTWRMYSQIFIEWPQKWDGLIFSMEASTASQ